MKQNKNNGLLSALALFSQIGLIMFCTLAVSLAIGYFLDIWLSTTPWLLIVFAIIGIIAAIRNMYITITKPFKKPKN